MIKIKNAKKVIFFAILTIAALIAMIIPASALLAYDVTIQDDNQSYVVKTSKSEAMDILSDYNIELGAKDKLILDRFEKRKGGVIEIDRYNNIYIKKDNDIKMHGVYANNVKDALTELGIDIAEDEYQLNCSYNDYIEKNMVIEFKKIYSIEIHVDGTVLKEKSVSKKISDILAEQKIALQNDDYTEPSLDTVINENINIIVHRVEYKTETRIEAVKYSTIKKEDSTLDEGKTKVENEGVNGEAQVTYLIKYIDGVEDSKETQKKEIIKNPINEILLVGTKENNNSNSTNITDNGRKSYNGLNLNETINGRYTCYCACSKCGSGNGVTASGKKITNGMPNPYYVACNWLPLGSIISVDGTNYTVVDRGGSGLSSVGRIDIFVPEGHAACYRKGTGSCKITILRFGW